MSDFTVTDQAVEKLKEYLEQNNISSALRIALMQGGWAGPSLGLALDEPKDNDKVYDQDDLTFLVEEGLMDTCGSIRVEFIDAGPRSGFGITSTNSIGNSGSGCSSGSCGSGGCGWPLPDSSSGESLFRDSPLFFFSPPLFPVLSVPPLRRTPSCKFPAKNLTPTVSILNFLYKQTSNQI